MLTVIHTIQSHLKSMEQLLFFFTLNEYLLSLDLYTFAAIEKKQQLEKILINSTFKIYPFLLEELFKKKFDYTSLSIERKNQIKSLLLEKCKNYNQYFNHALYFTPLSNQ